MCLRKEKSSLPIFQQYLKQNPEYLDKMSLVISQIESFNYIPELENQIIQFLEEHKENPKTKNTGLVNLITTQNFDEIDIDNSEQQDELQQRCHSPGCDCTDNLMQCQFCNQYFCSEHLCDHIEV